MARKTLFGLLGALAMLSAIGCQDPTSNRVPWWRGIPASLLAANSLEAEAWKRQRTGYAEGWPVPPKPVVGPLGPADGGIAPPPRQDMDHNGVPPPSP